MGPEQWVELDVPLKRVKKRRVIQQPLSDLAVEIAREALRASNKQYVFACPLGDQHDLRGRRRPWPAILALMMRGSHVASIIPRARRPRSPCPPSPARSTIIRRE